MIFLIDGNYFSNRTRSALGLTFKDEPEADRQTLLWECTQTLCSEIRRLKVITQVIVARDTSSWRKQEEPVYPIGDWKDPEDQNYKANRDWSDRPFDAKKFFEAYDDWLKMLEDKLGIPVVAAPRAEADDTCAILAHTYASKGFEVLLWTSDGDYVQLLGPNVHLLKFPKRQLWSSLEHCSQTAIFNTSPNMLMLSSQFKKSDIVYDSPEKWILKKMVYGDGKDNVPPSFFWLTKDGSKRRPSVSFIEKALEYMKLDIDRVTKAQMYDDNFMREFYMNLLWVTKQTAGIEHTKKVREQYEYNATLRYALYDETEAKAQLEHALKVYQSNRRLKMLDATQIPAEVKGNIFSAMQSKQNMSHDINVLADFKKTAKLAGIAEPEKKDEYFTPFDLSKGHAHLDKPSQPIIDNPLGDLLNDIL